MKFPAFTGWGYSKDFPRPAVKTFRARWNEINHEAAETTENSKKSTEKPVDLPKTVTIKDLVAKFTEELKTLGGHVVATTTPEVTSQVISLLKEKDIKRVQVWESVPGLDWDAITEAGISVQGDADETIKAGITGALSGIAETGTLVIKFAPLATD